MTRLSIPHWRRAAALLALGAFALTAVGCFGRFPLTRASYQFNRDLSDDKYVRSIAFWPLIFMHAGAALADTIIVNPMEFWSGERVVREARLQDGSTLTAVAHGAQPVELTLTRNGQVLSQHALVRLSADTFQVRDADQRYLGTIRIDPSGQVQVI